MGKVKIDNFVCLNGNIWNLFLQKCLLSRPLLFIWLMSKLLNLEASATKRVNSGKKMLKNLPHRNHKGMKLILFIHVYYIILYINCVSGCYGNFFHIVVAIPGKYSHVSVYRTIGPLVSNFGFNRAADQRLCFRYIDCTISLLPKSEISSIYPSSVTHNPICTGPGRKPRRQVFS